MNYRYYSAYVEAALLLEGVSRKVAVEKLELGNQTKMFIARETLKHAADYCWEASIQESEDDGEVETPPKNMENLN